MQNLKAGQIFIDTDKEELSSGEVSISDLLKGIIMIEAYLSVNENMSQNDINVAKAITALRIAQ